MMFFKKKPSKLAEYLDLKALQLVEIEEVLKLFKELRSSIRQNGIGNHAPRICMMIHHHMSVSCVSRASENWKFNERVSRSSWCSAYPVDHLTNHDIGNWEGKNWFYRVHLLNHVINSLEDYIKTRKS